MSGRRTITTYISIFCFQLFCENQGQEYQQHRKKENTEKEKRKNISH